MSEDKFSPLTDDQVGHIAMLARLQMSDEERARAAHDLAQIFALFDKLGELNTDDVEPTAHVLPVTNVLRVDSPRPSLPPAAALQNAPSQDAGMFQVPRVVEAD